jgi:uncharacterized RDD family membrane protein YckC
MEKWYYIENDGKKGPYTIEELKDKNINPDTLVWTDKMTNWEKAKHIEPLRKIIVAVPPPIPGPEEHREVENTQDQAIDNQDYFGYELASKSQRLFASLVGGIIVAVVIVILVIGMGVDLESIPEEDSYFNITEILFSAFLGLLLGVIFYPLFAGNLGHRIFGIKVISSETGEDHKSPLQGALREVLKNVLSFLVVPVIWLLFDKKKQNLYDKITKTLVVKRKD